MVVFQLEDHARAPAGQDVLGSVELPAGVGCRVDEPPVGRSGLLVRFQAGHAFLPEDPSQRGDRRDLAHTQIAHLVVDADRSVVQPRGLQRLTHAHGQFLDVLGHLGRRAAGPPRAGLQRSCLALGLGARQDQVEGLAGDAVLGAKRSHRAPWGIRRPLRDGKADTRINRIVLWHAPSRTATRTTSSYRPEVSPPTTREVSPMS